MWMVDRLYPQISMSYIIHLLSGVLSTKFGRPKNFFPDNGAHLGYTRPECRSILQENELDPLVTGTQKQFR